MSPSPRTLNYRARVAALRSALGGHCRFCSESVTLEFDCIVPMGNDHHKVGSMARISFYERLHLYSNVQLLCPRHHREKSKDDMERKRGKWYPMI